MADDNVLKVQIQLDDGTVAQGFAKIEAEGKSAFQQIGEYAAGQLTARYFQSAIGEVRATLNEALSSAASFGAEVQKLNGNLALSGQYSTATSKSFLDLADKIQATTAYSDDQVLSIAALGSNFTHSAEQTRKLTTATLDFAAATGRDANEAAQQLSLTLQGNIGRLGRYFPELKAFTQAQLEAGAAVDFVASRFQGSATSQSNTYAASISQIKNAYDDLLKSIGQFITENPQVIASVKFLASELLSAATAITNLRTSGSSIAGLLELIPPVGSVITTYLIQPLEIAANFVNGLVRIFGVLGTTVVTVLSAMFDAFQLVNKGAYAFVDSLLSIVTGKLKDGEIQKAFVDEYRAAFATTLGLAKSVASQTANAFGVVSTFLDATPVTDGLENAFNRYQEVLNKTNDTEAKFVNQHKERFDILAKNIPNIFPKYEEVGPQVKSLGDVFDAFAEGVDQAATKISVNLNKNIKEAAGQAFTGFANAAAAGFAAIGRAIVQGKDVFKAFAGAVLSAVGQTAIQLGTFFILAGLGRDIFSFGADLSASALIGIGAALTVLGGALSAYGSGVTGTSNPATSVNTGGGSAVDTSPATSSDSASGISQTQTQGVTVNIQGDVLDSRETGLRIVDLINDSFNTAGAKVVYT